MTDRRPPDLRPAAFFDLDKTLIPSSAATAFARPFLRGGLLSRRAVLRAARAQLAFHLASATEDRTERVRAQLSAMVVGWDVDRVAEVVRQSVQGAVGSLLSPAVLDLVARHRAAGHAVVVVSASSDDLVRPIAALVGADDVIASRMTVEDGRYTGAIDFYAYGPAKAVAMRDLAARRGYDLAASTAYTDSATDAPMLDAVGHGVVVDPDRGLRALAAVRGWEPLVLHRRPLTRALARVPARTAVAVLITATGLAAALLLARSRSGIRAPVSDAGHSAGHHLGLHRPHFPRRAARAVMGRTTARPEGTHARSVHA
ncbi:HAD family hydrolase [Cellulomonas triticagri]|uniref:HAD-IB family hydrolase n=1 Tax=Cellulomonas triticagri TaxID=2483352 RepID=A0A3M2IQ30_9CELL|nr:HAD-IB family hydrolase [Cellulomonas triticagri]RMI02046.1 HAD-IB family hydrolase [Cellulomonas triticagri]